MPGITSTVHIDSDPETVFAIMTELENTPLWVMGIVGTEPLQRGPIRTGYRYRETRHIGAKETTRIFEIIEHIGPGEGKAPPFTHVAQSAQMGFKTTYYYLIEDHDHGGSRVEMTLIVKATNPFSAIFLPLVVRELKKQDGDQLKKLKGFIETMPPPIEKEEPLPPPLAENEEIAHATEEEDPTMPIPPLRSSPVAHPETELRGKMGTVHGKKS